MTVKINLKNIKDKLKDETLDLSLYDLQEVPVREIVSVRKATHLDLSNNLLTSLPSTFVTLKQIVKLNLSHNMLTEIPENFGEMRQLKYLDLYDNQISRLPLSLGELKNLRWLDLNNNPLTPAVASVAGPCSNLSECQACARNIVSYLSHVKLTIEEERLRKLNAINADADKNTTPAKKAGKKKKKKLEENENKKNTLKNDMKLDTNVSQSTENEIETRKTQPDNTVRKTRYDYKGNSNSGFCQTVIRTIIWISLFIFTFALLITIVPIYYQEETDMLLDYLERYINLPLKDYQKTSSHVFHISTRLLLVWANTTYETLKDAYDKYF